MRTAVIAGNWKMNKTDSEAAVLASELAKEVGKLTDRTVILCPPFTSLKTVSEAVKNSPIKIGAQTLHWEKNGAFTGMVSAEMLKSVGCTYVIIGHSEQRQFFGETDETVNKRTRAALDAGLLPIVCVGETLDERKAGRAEAVVGTQVENGLKGFTVSDMDKIIIAYEPVWAIGTGQTATPEDADSMHKFIRGLVQKIWGAPTAEKLVIQYGGSVKADNVDELMAKPNIDGALVGGASLKSDSFARIVNFK